MAGLLVNGAALLLIGVALIIPLPQDKVVFLDVGQGDAILLQDGTRQVLIDGGPGMAVLQRLGEELPWFDRRIEVVVATHPDRDHLEGLLHVLERYEVGLVVLPQLPHTSQLQEAWLEKLQEKLARENVAYRFGWGGQQLTIGEQLRVRLLGPWVEGGALYAPGGKTNNGSILTRGDFHDMSFLLTAAAEAVVERKLVPRYGELLDVEELKAGHHGRKASTTAELLAAASPKSVVISAGRDNSYGHPHPDVLARLKDVQVLQTLERGSIRFTRRDRWWLLPAR